MGCDGIWEKKSNEEAVKWVYEQIKTQRDANGDKAKLDIEKIVADLLNDNIASDVSSSGKSPPISLTFSIISSWSGLR